MLIITGSDDNYVPGVLVLIASAALHNPGARFAVLDMGIGAANRDRIDALGARLGVGIRRIEISGDSFDKLLVKRAHLTRSAFLRLLIPQLFPDESRAIYMDCDMVVMGDLSPLQDMDLGQNLIAAVPCASPDPIEVAATGHEIGSYVNSGLLVMNLPLWRAEETAAACTGLLSDPDRPLLNEDQSAINIVTRGRILLLDPRYNVYTDPASYKRIADFPSEPVVLHYVVNNKPWNLPTPLGGVWRFHAGRIADLMPPRRKLTLRRRVSLWNRDRKLILGLAMRRPKYRLRRAMLSLMEGQVTRGYLRRVTALPGSTGPAQGPRATLPQAGSLA